ncbi:EpsI family protein [Aquabacterium fontiphilum]|jgi:EpsI family protein|uniref:exosortase-associated protein EpsI, B-type n=1 Tax=Aquabacterium fontiphilum TaxID=450365 RepID=UPI0013777684|nr:exosortase-associated protein EpsI, B-type [Aquabacterium fontiphilum]NBD22218.1 EpsI family protein [Aquabacterium fontiphilum]
MSVAKRLLPAVVAAGLMVFAGWFGHWAQPDTRMADVSPRPPLSAALPDQIGSWRVDKAQFTVPLPPDVAAQVAAIYTEVADRVYINDKGERIMLTIAYGKDQSDGFKVHRPEVCYAAQGFKVSKPRDGDMQLGDFRIPVKHVETQLQTRFEPVTYWMVIGDQVVNSPMRHKLAQIGYAFDGLIADGLLVRVSSFSRDPEEAYRLQERFLREWMPLVPEDQRARFFGQGQV